MKENPTWKNQPSSRYIPSIREKLTFDPGAEHIGHTCKLPSTAQAMTTVYTAIGTQSRDITIRSPCCSTLSAISRLLCDPYKLSLHSTGDNLQSRQRCAAQDTYTAIRVGTTPNAVQTPTDMASEHITVMTAVMPSPNCTPPGSVNKRRRRGQSVIVYTLLKAIGRDAADISLASYNIYRITAGSALTGPWLITKIRKYRQNKAGFEHT